jgi:arylsulfatase A-like enzyme
LPNLVVILVDDMGYGDLSIQGSADIRTPNIDSIAKNGVRCTSGYVTAPQCSPSRAGLLTGQYQERFAHEANPEIPFRSSTFGLTKNKPTFGKYLHAAGYVTGAVGKWDLGDIHSWSHPKNRGFDEWYGFLTGARSYQPTSTSALNIRITTSPTEGISETRYVTEELTAGAVGFMERNASQPFALYVAYSAPHEPYEVPAAYLARNQHVQNADRRVYASMITALDDGVGEILGSLKKHNLSGKTLVFFLSDNGAPANHAFTVGSNAPLRGWKGQLYEGGIRVPFLVQWPGSRIPVGSTYDQPVSTLDVIPTALAAAGKAAPAELEGVNLLPYLLGERKGKPHEVLFWRWMGHKAVRAGDWKWVVTAQREQAELYNLVEDPEESVNLADKLSERAEELTGLWRTWNRELAAPAWRFDPQIAMMRERYYGEGMRPYP